jgi:hypothetical protein
MNRRHRLERARSASSNSVHQSLATVGMIHQRLRTRREASTNDPNCGGSMMRRPHISANRSRARDGCEDP